MAAINQHFNDNQTKDPIWFEEPLMENGHTVEDVPLLIPRSLHPYLCSEAKPHNNGTLDINEDQTVAMNINEDHSRPWIEIKNGQTLRDPWIDTNKKRTTKWYSKPWTDHDEAVERNSRQQRYVIPQKRIFMESHDSTRPKYDDGIHYPIKLKVDQFYRHSKDGRIIPTNVMKTPVTKMTTCGSFNDDDLELYYPCPQLTPLLAMRLGDKINEYGKKHNKHSCMHSITNTHPHTRSNSMIAKSLTFSPNDRRAQFVKNEYGKYNLNYHHLDKTKKHHRGKFYHGQRIRSNKKKIDSKGVYQDNKYHLPWITPISRKKSHEWLPYCKDEKEDKTSIRNDQKNNKEDYDLTKMIQKLHDVMMLIQKQNITLMNRVKNNSVKSHKMGKYVSDKNGHDQNKKNDQNNDDNINIVNKDEGTQKKNITKITKDDMHNLNNKLVMLYDNDNGSWIKNKTSNTPLKQIADIYYTESEDETYEDKDDENVQNKQQLEPIRICSMTIMETEDESNDDCENYNDDGTTDEEVTSGYEEDESDDDQCENNDKDDDDDGTTDEEIENGIDNAIQDEENVDDKISHSSEHEKNGFENIMKKNSDFINDRNKENTEGDKHKTTTEINNSDVQIQDKDQININSEENGEKFNNNYDDVIELFFNSLTLVEFDEDEKDEKTQDNHQNETVSEQVSRSGSPSIPMEDNASFISDRSQILNAKLSGLSKHGNDDDDDDNDDDNDDWGKKWKDESEEPKAKDFLYKLPKNLVDPSELEIMSTSAQDLITSPTNSSLLSSLKAKYLNLFNSRMPHIHIARLVKAKESPSSDDNQIITESKAHLLTIEEQMRQTLKQIKNMEKQRSSSAYDEEEVEPPPFGHRSDVDWLSLGSLPEYNPSVNQPSLYHFLEILNEYTKNANLSEKAYRVILNTKVKGAALDTILQNKNRPLKKILTLLKLRFAGTNWPNSLYYEKQLDEFSRQEGENLHSTMARYENILRNLHLKLPQEELNTLLEKDLRRSVKRFADQTARTQLHRMEVLASRRGEVYDYATRLSILALEEKLTRKDQVPTYGPYLNNISLENKEVQDKEMEELTNLFCSAFGMKRPREEEEQNQALPRAKSPRQDQENIFKDREKARKFLENIQSGRTPSPSTSPGSSRDERSPRSPFQRPKSERYNSGRQQSYRNNSFDDHKEENQSHYRKSQPVNQDDKYQSQRNERYTSRKPPPVVRTEEKLPFKKHWQTQQFQGFQPNISYPKPYHLDGNNHGYYQQNYFKSKDYNQEQPRNFTNNYNYSEERSFQTPRFNQGRGGYSRGGYSRGYSRGGYSREGRNFRGRGYGRQDYGRQNQDPNIVRQTLRMDNDRFYQNLSLEKLCTFCDPNVLPLHSIKSCPAYRSNQLQLSSSNESTPKMDTKSMEKNQN